MKIYFSLLTCLALLFEPIGVRADAPAAPDADSFATNTAITVIFDNSGSMEGTKIDEAKAAFNAWLSKTPATYTWSLICFNDGGTLAVPFGPNRDAVGSAINGFRANTNTPIVNSLKIAAKQIMERRAKIPYERQLVLLFTDGEENQDPGGDDEVLKIITKMRAHNIEVVCIGYHGDGDYLAAAATHYYQADSADALKAGLDKVDAEVDLGGEIQISPQDLEAIKALPPIPKPAEATGTKHADADQAPAGSFTPDPNANAGINAGQLVVVVLICVLVLVLGIGILAKFFGSDD